MYPFITLQICYRHAYVRLKMCMKKLNGFFIYDKITLHEFHIDTCSRSFSRFNIRIRLGLLMKCQNDNTSPGLGRGRLVPSSYIEAVSEFKQQMIILWGYTESNARNQFLVYSRY